MNNDLDKLFMAEAIKEAKLAYNDREVPVGAVIVIDNKIVARGRNTRIKDNLVTSHAEINAILSLEKELNQRILDNATMYVTLEPCPMCAYAIMETHIKRLVYGAIDPKRGAISTLDIFNKSLGSKVEVCGNIEKEECESLLKEFFKELR